MRAGPGDPELLTRKAERVLAAATVVFYDALVGAGVLDLAAPDARLVHVGKRSGRHSTDQKTIARLIVTAALAGERVVRLNGGDPAIFGRAAEELQACRSAGVSVRICPGVTAASAAAAAPGASLTLRGLARRLTFITAHARAGEELELDWASLADPRSTLAVYMGKAAAVEIARRLISAGMPNGTLVAVVENAGLPGERTCITRLDLLGLSASAMLNDAPALLLVGEAIAAQPSSEQRVATSTPDGALCPAGRAYAMPPP